MTFRLIKVVCSHGIFFLIIVNLAISEEFSAKSVYILYKEMMGKNLHTVFTIVKPITV